MSIRDTAEWQAIEQDMIEGGPTQAIYNALARHEAKHHGGKSRTAATFEEALVWVHRPSCARCGGKQGAPMKPGALCCWFCEGWVAYETREKAQPPIPEGYCLVKRADVVASANLVRLREAEYPGGYWGGIAARLEDAAKEDRP